MSDPRTDVAQLTDELPLLLFPLRIETRFMRPDTTGRGHELWVRVFPDPCLVDTFESEPSQIEIASARRYWQAVWRSRGEDGERAAWRNLVASHGAGRARWLREAHGPLDPVARPDPAPPPETLVLAIPVEQGWKHEEAELLVQLWEQAWREGADGGAEERAVKLLTDKLGDEERARLLWSVSRPLGFNDPPPGEKAPAEASLLVVPLLLPAAGDAPAQSWSSPPVVKLLPEQLLCVVETAGGRVERLGEPIELPLQVGPDPSADEGSPDLRPIPETGELEVSDALRWTVDFERAVKVGMGFTIPLSVDQWEAGADRVTVVGVRLGDDPEEGGRKHLEELLAHHRDGRSGLELIAQGTPTNNTEDDAAGWTRAEEADAAFDRLRDAIDLGEAADPPPPALARADGRWLADGLGIDPALLRAVAGAGGADQAEARLMNAALWPATLGYFLDTMMEPLIGEETVDQARWFFTSHVSGRGPLPPIRIGQQPYGIVPAIAFDRTKKRAAAADGDGKEEREQFLLRLHRLLHLADDDWGKMSQEVVSLGTPGADVEAALLEVLGLHPSSAEFHYRYAQSLAHLFNLAGLFGLWQLLLTALLRAALDQPALDLLMRLGDGEKRRPAILDKYFLGRQGRLLGAIVDDRPLSEADPVRVWTDDGANYLTWLAGAASSGLEELRQQQGFVEGRPPNVLLYLLLRHALLLGYADAGVRLHRAANVPAAQVKALRREPPFVHVADAGASESRWAPLFKQDDAITGEPGLTVAEAVAKRLWGGDETAQLTAQIEAVKRLADLPTARLERLLAEHVDTCSYRFDAWRTGWLAHRLEQMREQRPRGVHVGAFGWLLDVRRSEAQRTPVEPLGGELEKLFQAAGDPVLERDPANGGFVHAPSTDQAVTAAVLRAGYLSNAADGNPEPLQVNLSSERVRLALSTLDGIRNGQRMGALLGYRLERGLHDGHPGLELDRFILPLRTAFPLVAQRIRTTRAADGVRAAAARNVADGLRIVEHVESSAGLDRYPFGRADLLPADATAAERAAIEAEVRRLRDVNDAVGDLLLAESVHQATQARYDRSAAALDTVSTGGWPPDPEVVRTPRPGVALTHRLALQLDPDAAAAADATPRAAAEPRLDRWLETVLPDLADVRARATWSDPRAADPEAVSGEVTVSLTELGLRPVDLLAIVHADGGQQMAELDDRVVAQALRAGSVPLDVLPQIRYLDPVGGAIRVFDVAAPVRRLRSLVGRARPLRPGDWTLADQATRSADADVARDPAPVSAALAGLQTLASDLGRQATALDALVRGTPAERARAPDRAIDQTAALFARAALHGVPQTGRGFAWAQRAELAAGLLRRLAERLATWDAKLADFDLLLAEFDGLDRAIVQRDTALMLLRRAEISVAPAVTADDPDGDADLATLRAALPPRRTAFAARRRALAALVARPPATLAALLRAATGLLPFSDVDLEPFDLAPEDAALATLHGDLLSAAVVVLAEVRRRADAARALLDQHDAAATATARVEALDAAARAIFGDEFVLVPDAGVQPAQAQETTEALTASGGGDLTAHLTGVLGVEFPVDEWLTGVARVREQARAWEQVVLQAGAFGLEEPALTPLQFPFLPGDHWLALGFPPDARLDRDRLLYTAALPAGFDPAARRCGLLLDEWTEVIPAETQETAIATHFDRPNSEPPQALLLVLPTQRTGSWNWADVVGALDDTLAMARRRAVEPVHVDRTPYARLLPATVSATTLRGLSIGLALARNNPGVSELAQKEAGDG